MGPVSRDEGASCRKLQVSPFLSQFAHVGCLPSHYVLSVLRHSDVLVYREML